MRICMILEGCYPYVRGGVSSWMHNLILANPQHEYVLWTIGAKAEDKGKFKYEMPDNVIEVHEVFLDDALKLHASASDTLKFTKTEIQELKKLIMCEDPDWNVLFRMYNIKKVGAVSFLRSEAFLEILLEVCKVYYSQVPFSEFFFSIRSMFLPTLYLLEQKVPKADVYHSTSTGYGGILAALGAWKEKKPYILTEHGIYTREREEEILRAKWIQPYFKQRWIDMFYMLAHAAYDRANSVTALFQRYSDIQTELGCDPHKQIVIRNGIKIDRFINIPSKKDDGYIDITAIVRIHPIKDIKTMIHAFLGLKQHIPNAKLHILGDTDDEQYREECISLIEQLGIPDIDMPGNVNVSEYLKNTDFTILTSISEGQPLSVLESLAAGRPCVTTDVGCCRELIYGGEDDNLGSAGFCLPPMHAQAIAEAMETLATRPDLRREMGEVGKKRINTYYVDRDMIDNYNNNYDRVVKRWQALALN